MKSTDRRGSAAHAPPLADVRHITTFANIVRRLSVARSLPELMEIVTHAARALVGADGITFILRDGDRCYYAEEDAISALWKGRRFPMSACISGWCMREGRAAAIPDIYRDQRIPHDAYRPTFVRSLAMVPVRQDDPIAALGAYWVKTRQIKAQELELLQCVADAAALVISNADLAMGRSSGRSGAEELSPARSSFAGLSKRQLEILGLLAEGKTNAEIAAALCRSPSTIKIHVSAILRHFNVRSRTEAALVASSANELAKRH